MKKIIVLLVFFFISCGSIKKNKEHFELDSETSSTEQTNISRWINSNSYTLEPVDLTKPILLNKNGKTDTLYNTKVVYNNTKTKEIIHDSIGKKGHTKIEADSKIKETDNTKLFLGIFGIVILLIFLCFVFAIVYIGNKLTSITDKK